MLFVKIVNDEVAQVWDTQPPAGEDGWKAAIEVRPTIDFNRFCYTQHTFDLTKDPVEIVWGTREITVDERKGSMKGNARAEYEQIAREELRKDVEGGDSDPAVVLAASSAYKAKVAQIDAATTHEELDAI
jgi:hypothetical protein